MHLDCRRSASEQTVLFSGVILEWRTSACCVKDGAFEAISTHCMLA